MSKKNKSESIFNEEMTKKSKKKKNKKKKDDYKEKYFNDTIITQWDIIKEDMEKMQKKLNKADGKEFNKKNSTKITFKTCNKKKQIRVRKDIIKLFRDSSFLDSVMYIITNTKSMVKIISKMFCMLVVSLMSIDKIRNLIPKELISKIDAVFNLAIKI